jgi:S-disulfanyl-L-cysteine oxidoreductase SoxD
MGRLVSVRPSIIAAGLAAALASVSAVRGGDAHFDVGVPASGPVGSGYAIAPDGIGLPAGHGTAAEGRIVYTASCASCHGPDLEGQKAIGAPPLIGGRGTLASAKPLKTVESYWPYATTVFDYIHRAMPFNAPGSLTDDQVYAVTAYVLARGHVIDDGLAVDAGSLPKIRMPNAAGFVPDPRFK